MDCGQTHCLALDDQSRVWSWGHGEMGALGYDCGRMQCSPHQVSFPVNLEPTLSQNEHEDCQAVKQIYCGEYHSVALTRSGHVWVWGDGQFGQLGLEDRGHAENHFTSTPRLLYFPHGWGEFSPTIEPNLAFQHDFQSFNAERKHDSGPIRIESISAGGFATAAKSESGRWYVWGWNGDWGTLGCHVTGIVATPVPFSILEPIGADVESIVFGPHHAVIATKPRSSAKQRNVDPTHLPQTESEEKKEQSRKGNCEDKHSESKLAIKSAKRENKSTVGQTKIAESNFHNQAQHEVASVKVAESNESETIVYVWGDDDRFSGIAKESTSFYDNSVEHKNGCGYLLQSKESVSSAKINQSLLAYNIVQVVAGSHNLALTEEGAVFSWGRGKYGQLGRISLTEDIVPNFSESNRDSYPNVATHAFTQSVEFGHESQVNHRVEQVYDLEEKASRKDAFSTSADRVSREGYWGSSRYAYWVETIEVANFYI